WRAMLWLAWRQARGFALGLVMFCLALGVLMPIAPQLFWPVVTLVVGALCGATVFLDEQLSGSFRFLSDQRVPLGRVWLVKVGLRFALAVGAALVLLLPLIVVEV